MDVINRNIKSGDWLKDKRENRFASANSFPMRGENVNFTMSEDKHYFL